MGSLLTYFYYGSNEPDPVTGLTPKEKHLIKSTWGICKKDLAGLGMQLFVLFFKDFPEYQQYFVFRNIPLDKLKEDNRLKAHATSVAYALSSIVDNVEQPDILISLLHKTAESHAKRNIEEKVFTDLKATVIKLLEEGLGSKFTKDCRNAWQKTLDVAFKVILDHLKEESEK